MLKLTLIILSLALLTGCEQGNTAVIESKAAKIDRNIAEYKLTLYYSGNGRKEVLVGKELWTNSQIGDGFNTETFTTFSIAEIKAEAENITVVVPNNP
jgi:hypothetical protein